MTSLPDGCTDLLDGRGRSDEDLVIAKPGWGAFGRSVLHDELQKRGVTQVVITGRATSFGVETTARWAYDEGYHVTIAVDAISDMSLDAHDRTVQRVLPVLGETGSAAEIAALLGSA